MLKEKLGYNLDERVMAQQLERPQYVLMDRRSKPPSITFLFIHHTGIVFLLQLRLAGVICLLRIEISTFDTVLSIESYQNIIRQIWNIQWYKHVHIDRQSPIFSLVTKNTF